MGSWNGKSEHAPGLALELVVTLHCAHVHVSMFKHLLRPAPWQCAHLLHLAIRLERAEVNDVRHEHDTRNDGEQPPQHRNQPLHVESCVGVRGNTHHMSTTRAITRRKHGVAYQPR